MAFRKRFSRKVGQQIPEMTNEYCESVSKRYQELYENIIGEKFIPSNTKNILERIETNVNLYLENYFNHKR